MIHESMTTILYFHIIKIVHCSRHSMVLTIFSIKSSSNLKPRDSFGICSSWGFWNYPRLLNLMKIWLTYWRLNTPDIISKFNFFSFRSKDENVWPSISLPNLLVEILKIQDNTSFSSLLWNEKKINFEMILVVFNLQ